MIQVLAGLSPISISTSAVQYAPIAGGLSFSSTEALGTQPWAVAGTFANLVIRLSVAPGAGKSRAFTVRINGVDTALTCTISDTALTARDTTHSVSIAAGDRIALATTPTGSPAATGVNGARMVLEFTSTATGESGYGWGAVAIAAGAPGTKYAAPLRGSTWTAAAGDATDVVPLTGTITSLRLWTSTAVGASRSDTATLYLNGVKQDGTGGTVNTTASLTTGNTTASSSFSLAVVPGDTLYLEGVKVGTGSEGVGYALALVAATDGQSVVANGAAATVPSSTRYTVPGWGQATAWQTVEATLAHDGGVSSVVLSQLRVRLASAPGAGTSYTFSLRVNSASPAGTPSVTVADLATTGTDGSGTVTVADTNAWVMRSVPSGSPAAVSPVWAMIQTVGAAPPAAVERVEPFLWMPV